jgi:photosystem II stability/assembly factor-like uncharacterized protein
LSSYNIGWFVAKTNVLSGTGPSLKNTGSFNQNSIYINDSYSYHLNSLNLTDNMYTFDLTYINDTGSSAVTKSNPIGNVQYTNFYNPSKTYPYIGKNFSGISSSSNGNIIIACASNGYLYVTIDGGLNWTENSTTGSNKNWCGVASSADGKKLAAVENGGYIWTSSNSGTTWTRQTGSGSRLWDKRIVMSPDGQYLVAMVITGYVYTSADGGVTWTAQTTSPTLNWGGLAISDDATTIYVAGMRGEAIVGNVWVSKDSGSTWTSIPGAGSYYWRSLCISSDATNIIAIGGSYIYLSTDSSRTWRVLGAAGSRNWLSLTVSRDFTNIAACEYNGTVYYSRDSGTTWNKSIYLKNGLWTSITGDYTGQYLNIVENAGSIWWSNNYGVSWFTYTTPPGSGNWPSVAISKDASILMGGTFPPYISNDGGVHWRVINLIQYEITVIASGIIISDDNKYIVFTICSSDQPTTIFISSDSGYTWNGVTQTQMNRPFTCISGSSDCSTIILGTLNSSLYLSTNRGSTWNSITGPPQSARWNAVSSDSTGKYLIVVPGNYNDDGNIWVSGNFGVTWGIPTLLNGTRQMPVAQWNGLASSSSGKYAYACNSTYIGASTGAIWGTSNYGVTWTELVTAGSRGWGCIACSPYGNNVIAGVSNNGPLWTSSDFGATWRQQSDAGAYSYWRDIKYSKDARSLIAIGTTNPGSTVDFRPGPIVLCNMTN